MKKAVKFGLIILLQAFFWFSAFSQTIVSGYLTDSLSGEPLISANVRAGNAQAQTNQYGFFSIETGDSLWFSSVGYASKRVWVGANENHSFSLSPANTVLGAVIVSKTKESSPKPMGNLYLSATELEQLPSIFGEKDAIKAIQFLPGIQKGVEGSTSFYVRGGSAGENLIQLDEATVYNANHLFGFFSVFNTDAIKGLDFYKGAFPAKYGGRLSSVSDIRMKEGNSKAFKAEGGISLISSRITLEGPIIKDKLSFLLSGRRTYLDPFMKLFQSDKDQTLYNFYDLNAKIRWEANAKNTFYLSSYLGNDLLSNSIDRTKNGSRTMAYSAFQWGNSTFTARWNHLFGQKLFANTSFIQTFYNSTRSNESLEEGSKETERRLNSFKSYIGESTLKSDFDFYRKAGQAFSFGAWFSRFHFVPREVQFIDTSTDLNIQNKIERKNSSTGMYAAVNWAISPKTKLNIGLREVLFQTGKKKYLKTEPRLSLKYELDSKSRLSLAYSRMHQFVNQVQSTGLGISTDLWFPSDGDFAPQQSDQISL